VKGLFMSVPVQCCAPCPVVIVTEIPGPEGENGTPGTNGVSAFTSTTADFIVPTIGNTVTVLVLNSTWMIVGENVFVEFAGYFNIVGIPSAQSVTLGYLNYQGNTNAGNLIAAGGHVSPTGTQASQTLLPPISYYVVGGSQALSASSVQILGPSPVVLVAKSYLLMATYRLDYDVATFAFTETIALKLRETVNGPADIASAVVNLNTPTVTTKTGTFIEGAFPPVIYAASAGDTIAMFGSIAATPYSGSLKAVEMSIVAIPLF
jgi:hypothetical protein